MYLGPSHIWREVSGTSIPPTYLPLQNLLLGSYIPLPRPSKKRVIICFGVRWSTISIFLTSGQDTLSSESRILALGGVVVSIRLVAHWVPGNSKG